MRSFAADLLDARDERLAEVADAHERVNREARVRALREALKAKGLSRPRDHRYGWVYYVQRGEHGPIKIGFTRGDLAARLSHLQVGSPDPLRLLACEEQDAEYELEMHKIFAPFRVAGEWFEPDGWVLDYIASIPASEWLRV